MISSPTRWSSPEPTSAVVGCVRAFTKAVESVDGVESCEAKTGAKSVKVTGKDFKTYEVMKALREAGFGGSFQ
jgi:copper chaperone CopZ